MFCKVHGLTAYLPCPACTAEQQQYAAELVVEEIDAAGYAVEVEEIDAAPAPNPF